MAALGKIDVKGPTAIRIAGRFGCNTQRDRAMSDIAELERRITYALERISAAAERGGASAGDLTGLKDQLAEEQVETERLRDRLQDMKDSHAAALEALEQKLDKVRDQISRQEHDLAKLRAVNAQLRENNAKLREANAAGLADAGLVNAAMAVEVEALRKLQEADRSELDAVLNELRPLVEESA